jgi:hypothetical protein
MGFLIVGKELRQRVKVQTDDFDDTAFYVAIRRMHFS